jgi:hypothetical protein
VKSYLLLGSIYSGTGVWSLEEYLKGEGSPENGFFLWTATLGKIFGQFTEDEYYGNGMVLHV